MQIKNRILESKLEKHFLKILPVDEGFYYSYNVVRKSDFGDHLMISTYPKEWVKEYKNNNYQFIDPVQIKALTEIRAFYWDSSISVNSVIDLNYIFTKSENYKILFGYTFVLHDFNGEMATFTISTENRAKLMMLINHNYESHNLFLVNFHSKYIELNEILINWFIYRKKSWSVKNNLSSMEILCLMMCKEGFNYNDVAKRLGVSCRTIRKISRKTSKKFSVPNFKHALQIFNKLGDFLR